MQQSEMEVQRSPLMSLLLRPSHPAAAGAGLPHAPAAASSASSLTSVARRCSSFTPAWSCRASATKNL